MCVCEGEFVLLLQMSWGSAPVVAASIPVLPLATAVVPPPASVRVRARVCMCEYVGCVCA